MIKVIKKTRKEIEEYDAYFENHEIQVNKTHYYYFSCDDCNIAYTGDDIIIESYDGKKLCPKYVSTGIFGAHKVCLNQMYGGDEDCFKKYYKIA